MGDYNSDEVRNVIRVKSIMDRIPESDQSVEYKTIIQMIQGFLHNNCQHEIVIDNIDVTPDKSVTVFYCKHCTESLDTIPSSQYGGFFRSDSGVGEATRNPLPQVVDSLEKSPTTEGRSPKDGRRPSRVDAPTGHLPVRDPFGGLHPCGVVWQQEYTRRYAHKNWSIFP